MDLDAVSQRRQHALPHPGFDTTIRSAGSPRVGLSALHSLFGTRGSAVLRCGHCSSTFLPRLPSTRLCFPRLPWLSPPRYNAGSDSRRAHTARRFSSLTLRCRPSIQPPTTSSASTSLRVTAACRADPWIRASPYLSRLAAKRRRNGFVILQAARSPPAALHPALLRRSCLRLHGK